MSANYCEQRANYCERKSLEVWKIKLNFATEN